MTRRVSYSLSLYLSLSLSLSLSRPRQCQTLLVNPLTILHLPISRFHHSTSSTFSHILLSHICSFQC
ncbi:unnamed protein product [Periconia digitata]|uniref:Secreted protein n=1 Tax=Periconia digitata TaxID=1303443 RepID=A0A9W4U6L9_9PLEO|nr:unnamed protein product [Periconia digitata]